MAPQTFVFIGRSGCGKGTQAGFLQQLIKEKDPSGEVFYIETGDYFRDFIKGDKYSNKLASEIMKNGDRQPDFLAVWMWSHVILDEFKGTEYLIFDGINRSVAEAMTFTTAMNFYNRKAVVINLNVSREWSKQRLLERKRFDDISKEEVEKRLNWYDRDSVPTIGYFEANNTYKVIRVDGEQTREKVHNDIKQNLDAYLKW